MKNTKIAWMESQYLFPHHFQQQERYIEALIETRAKAINPYAWGIESLVINDSLLIEGRMALEKVKGVMPDGCPFDLPLGAGLPEPIQISTEVRDQIVYLALPVYQAGSKYISLSNADDYVARYELKELDVYDYCSPSSSQETVETAQLKFQLVLGSSNLGNYSLLPLCKITEVTQEGAILLDKNFIPPVLSITASTRLKGFLTEVVGLVQQRADAIASRFNDGNKDKSSSAIVDFMLLQMLNRYEPMLKHISSLNYVHPLQLFDLLQSLSGELSTFTTKSKRPLDHVKFTHESLNDCYSPVVANIGKQLSVVLEQTAISLPLEKRQFGIYVSRLADRTLLSQARFVLAVKSGMAQDKLRSYFPAHVKIGSVETIRDLVNNQLSGISISPLSSAPREITYHSGFIYFELSSQSEHWRSLQKSGGFAFHIAGEIPDFSLEFWAIRES